MKNKLVKQRIRSQLAQLAISYKLLTDEFLAREITIDEFDKQFDALLENYALKIMNKAEVF